MVGLNVVSIQELSNMAVEYAKFEGMSKRNDQQSTIENALSDWICSAFSKRKFE
jgi:hypothetical protein